MTTTIERAHLLTYAAGPTGAPVRQAVAIGNDNGRTFVLDLTDSVYSVLPVGDHIYSRSDERRIQAAFAAALNHGAVRPVLKDFTNRGEHGRWYAEREIQGLLATVVGYGTPVVQCLRPLVQKPNRRNV